jgi:hypothetical protein
MIESSRSPNHIRIGKSSPYYPMSYNGYISPARLAMAQHLGRCLGSDEWIYYIDGNSFNSDISNLQLVSHKELNKLNEIRRTVRMLDKLSARLATLQSDLAEIRFNHTPCDCPRCTRSREARQAEYRL